MEKKLRLAVVGLGGRGNGLLRLSVLPLCEEYNVEIPVICDLYEDRINENADLIEKELGKRPEGTTDYKEILARDDVDAVMISTAWECHVDIAVAAMKAGKYVGLEVGGAYTVEDCWKLVDTFEETGTPCMLLENCCYGKRELMALNMVREGAFGEIVHCSGGYCHDLRQEIADGKENRHYRLRNYIHRNCENYPTHEIGPIAKLLDINNGNRFVSLSSFASRAKGLHEYILDRKGADSPLANVEFEQGDVVTTILRCAHGQTVTITLDTTLPRTYSRGFTVRGTKGAYFEDNDSIFIDHEHNKYEFEGKKIWDNAKEYEEKYQHKLWRDFVPKGGHDGMDWMVISAFLEAASRGLRAPIDVYDAAVYMAITALSEQSIACGGAPVAIPDFTRGKWHYRKDIESSEQTDYSLDRTDIYKDIYDKI